MLDKIAGLLTGGGAQAVADVVGRFLPERMSDAEKAAVREATVQATRNHELTVMQAVNSAEAEFNTRIKDMEGTATDLKALPIVGPLVLFLRGVQRPAWGFMVMVLDLYVFSGKWALVAGSQTESAFWIINLLVLGFLFGERAMKNVAPLIERMVKR